MTVSVSGRSFSRGNFDQTPRFKYQDIQSKAKGTQGNLGPGSYNSQSSLEKLEKKQPCSVLMVSSLLVDQALEENTNDQG